MTGCYNSRSFSCLLQCSSAAASKAGSQKIKCPFSHFLLLYARLRSLVLLPRLSSIILFTFSAPSSWMRSVISRFKQTSLLFRASRHQLCIFTGHVDAGGCVWKRPDHWLPSSCPWLCAGYAVWLLWFISRHLSVCLFLSDWSAVVAQQLHTDTTCPVEMKIWIIKPRWGQFHW